MVLQPLIPLLVPTQVPSTIIINISGAPRIHNIVHIPYFLGRPGSDPNTHIAKFEITCHANDVPVAKFQEVVAASLQEDAFAWYQRQPPFC